MISHYRPHSVHLGRTKFLELLSAREILSRQKTLNVYYLHRNANAVDPELWILRTSALNVEWKGQWEPIVATKVLAAPVVVFAGLGTPVAVLIESTKLLRNALPRDHKALSGKSRKHGRLQVLSSVVT